MAITDTTAVSDLCGLLQLLIRVCLWPNTRSDNSINLETLWCHRALSTLYQKQHLNIFSF